MRARAPWPEIGQLVVMADEAIMLCYDRQSVGLALRMGSLPNYAHRPPPGSFPSTRGGKFLCPAGAKDDN